MKRTVKTICLALAFVLSLSLFSCGEKNPDYIKKSYNTSAGTVTIWADKESFEGEEGEKAAALAANCFEKYYVLLTASDELSDVNSEVNVITDVDKSLCEAISYASELYNKTNGKFSPFSGAYTDALRQKLTEEEINEAKNHISPFTVEENTVKKSDVKSKLDFFAVAKGYALDMALKSLKKSGAAHGLASVDGITAVFGSKPDSTAYSLELSEGETTFGTFEITDGAVSKVNKKTENYSADKADNGFDAVSVYAEDAAVAQAVSYMLYNMTEKEIEAFYESKSVVFEAVIKKEDGTFIYTDRINGGSIYVPETTGEND